MTQLLNALPPYATHLKIRPLGDGQYVVTIVLDESGLIGVKVPKNLYPIVTVDDAQLELSFTCSVNLQIAYLPDRADTELAIFSDGLTWDQPVERTWQLKCYLNCHIETILALLSPSQWYTIIIPISAIEEEKSLAMQWVMRLDAEKVTIA